MRGLIFLRMNSKQIAFIIIGISSVFVFLCLLYTRSLEKHFATLEQKRVKQWAEATEMLIQADENTDVSFLTSIIEDNTTIPVYKLDKDGNILDTRNVKRPVKDPRSLNGPITVKIGDLVQYIYYEDSIMLRKLRYFPYIELSLILIFFAVSIYTLLVSQQNEQNQVWVGLCKETAHQLGTPISSLHAWYELLIDTYPNDVFLPQMQQDIDRLNTITHRFSNIGSTPHLHPTMLSQVIVNSVEYMKKRIGNSVQLSFESLAPDCQCMLNESLFAWVLENLIKNAVDAIKGSGQIYLRLDVIKNKACIDITDSGMGMDKKTQKKIFLPGFSTKKRGWGLGLSLAKRIIEQYHHGNIFVLNSVLKEGTTIRIKLDVLSSDQSLA